MIEWKKREYEQLYSEGEKRYERAEREYQRAKTDHEIHMNVRRNKAIEQNQKIERIQERFSASVSKAVEDYFIRVLHNGSYPETFPRKSQLVYTANSRQLTIEHDLPTFEAVSAQASSGLIGASFYPIHYRHMVNLKIRSDLSVAQAIGIVFNS